MAIFEEKLNHSGENSVVCPVNTTTGDEFENQLRPKKFDDYVGQTEVKNNMKVFTAAAQKRGESLDHILFYGPPGLGKTTIANIIATEMQGNLRITSGPALEKPGDLAAILTNLKAGDFLFIDEIHRLRLPIEEILYTAMEDFAIDLVIGKGPSARTMRMDVPKFTLLGATTRASMLSGPLRDRFGHIEKLRYYQPEELEQIITRSAQILNVEIEPTAAVVLAGASRRTPRIANRLLRRMRDFAEIEHAGVITKKVVEKSLQQMSVDKAGLDRADQEYLHVVAQKFNGGPVGVSTIAAAIGEDENTIEDMIEPFLIREGFLQKTPRGRILTPKASDRFGHPEGTLW
ncbi:Holliday junction branch migration DNA helicase RuvB [bacterium DOLZORAL124_38_8]|nr:MAG: Holliday junction branch migration DNA helicase RuvB [bacterium DOLZORAL124_38_8]